MHNIHTNLRHVSHLFREHRCIFLSPSLGKPPEAPREQQGVPQKYETTWERVQKDVNDIHGDVQKLLGHMKTIGSGEGKHVQAMSDRWTTMRKEKSATLKKSFREYNDNERGKQKVARKIQEIENGLGVIEATVYDESFREMIEKLEEIEQRVLSEKKKKGETIPYVTYQDRINEGWRQQIQEGTLTAKTAGVVFDGKVETVYFLDLPNFVHVVSKPRGQLTRYWGEVRTYFTEDQLKPGMTVNLYIGDDKNKAVTAEVEQAPNTPDGRKAAYLILPEDCEDLLSRPSTSEAPIEFENEPRATQPPMNLPDIGPFPHISDPSKPFQLPRMDDLDSLDRDTAPREEKMERMLDHEMDDLSREAKKHVEELVNVFTAGEEYRATSLASLDRVFEPYRLALPEIRDRVVKVGQDLVKETQPFGTPPHELTFDKNYLSFDVRKIEDPAEKALKEFDRDTEGLLKDIESRVRMGWNEDVPEMKIALKALQDRFVEHDKLYREHRNALVDRGHALERKFNEIPGLLHHLEFYDATYEFSLKPVTERTPERPMEPGSRPPERAPKAQSDRPSESLEEKIARAEKLMQSLADAVRDFGGFEHPRDPSLPQNSPNPSVYSALKELNDLLATFPADFTDWHKLRINRKIDGPYDWKYQIQKVPNEPRAEVVRLFARESEIIKYDEQKLESALTNLWSLLEGGYQKGIEEELNNTILEQSELDPEKTTAWVNKVDKEEWEGEDAEGVRYRLKREGILFTLEKIVDESSPSDVRPSSDSTETPPTSPGGTERPPEGVETLTVAEFTKKFDDLFAEMHHKLATQSDGVEAAKDVVRSKINPLVTRAFHAGLSEAVNDRAAKFSRVELKARDGTKYRFEQEDNLFALKEVDEGLDKDEREFLQKVKEIFKNNNINDAMKKLFDLLKEYLERHNLLTPAPASPRPSAEGSAAPPAVPGGTPEKPTEPRFEPREAFRPNENTEKIRQLEDQINKMKNDLRDLLQKWQGLMNKDPAKLDDIDSAEFVRLNDSIRRLQVAIREKEDALKRLRDGIETTDEVLERMKKDLAILIGKRDDLQKKVDGNTADPLEKEELQRLKDAVTNLQRAIELREKNRTSPRQPETTFRGEVVVFASEELQSFVTEKLFPKFKELLGAMKLNLSGIKVEIQGELVNATLRCTSDLSNYVATLKGILAEKVGGNITIELGSDKTSLVIKGLTREMFAKLARAFANIDIRFSIQHTVRRPSFDEGTPGSEGIPPSLEQEQASPFVRGMRGALDWLKGKGAYDRDPNAMKTEKAMVDGMVVALKNAKDQSNLNIYLENGKLYAKEYFMGVDHFSEDKVLHNSFETTLRIAPQRVASELGLIAGRAGTNSAAARDLLALQNAYFRAERHNA